MFGLYESGQKVTEKPEILFARLDVNEVLAKVEEKKAEETQPEKPAEPVIDLEPKAEITFDDFEKLQFQVGEIIAWEAVKKSLLPGSHRQPSKADSLRYQSPLHTGRDGRKKGYGTGKPKARHPGRRKVRGNAALRRGCGRQPGLGGSREKNALRIRVRTVHVHPVCSCRTNIFGFDRLRLWDPCVFARQYQTGCT